jgi:hypothetical protein
LNKKLEDFSHKFFCLLPRNPNTGGQMETVAWPAYSPGTLLELELSVQVTPQSHGSRTLVPGLYSKLFQNRFLKELEIVIHVTIPHKPYNITFGSPFLIELDISVQVSS